MAQKQKKQSSGKQTSRFVGGANDIRIVKPVPKKDKKK